MRRLPAVSPSRRAEIELTPAEQRELLESERVVIVSSLGPRGWPHSMPMWFVLRDGELWVWSYAKAQKVKNLERDARATLQVEDGEQYHELRGVMIEADTTIHRDLEVVQGIGMDLFRKYTQSPELAPEVVAMIEKQAPKRLGLQFTPQRTASWDHRKLAGVY